MDERLADEFDAMLDELNDPVEVAETIVAGFIHKRHDLGRGPGRLGEKLIALFLAAPEPEGWGEFAGLAGHRPDWWAGVVAQVAIVLDGLPPGPLHPHRGRNPRRIMGGRR
ncbi:MAG: hypothetical protein JWO31_1511 [Phycisphaerales bacterium]|nr:hypothetical protein [Phycisphaerales bacterium]